jgi:hypothetical protein
VLQYFGDAHRRDDVFRQSRLAIEGGLGATSADGQADEWLPEDKLLGVHVDVEIDIERFC